MMIGYMTIIQIKCLSHAHSQSIHLVSGILHERSVDITHLMESLWYK